MVSGRNGRFTRSVLSALAAMATAITPSLVSSAAMASTPEGGKSEGTSVTAEPSAAKPEAKVAPEAAPKHAKKTHAEKAPAEKAPKALKTHKKHAEAESKPPALSKAATNKAPAQSAASKAGKGKKTASRSVGTKKKTAKKADSEAPRRRCAGATVTLDRGGLEEESVALLDCHGAPLEGPRRRLSVLARSWGAARPEAALLEPAPARGGPATGEPAPSLDLAPGVRLLDPGLLVRLGAVARNFPGKGLSLVSGYRPRSRGSLHESARALDLRVAGVPDADLVAFCRTLPDTGCGYYPNSSFVHLDVRNPGTGSVSWIDASDPGEPPRYVPRWPPRDEPGGEPKPVEPPATPP